MALRGINVIEFGGLAPGPFCGIVLADLGARVVRIGDPRQFYPDILTRGKLSLTVDIKKRKGVDVIKKLCNTTDVLIDPFRAGVMENIGLGPKEMMKENQKLIYARLTGYGQHGCLSRKAGHDINFLAMSGVLSMLNSKQQTQPNPPQNLLADFAGGGLMCALGIIVALFKRSTSGLGQVVDVSMTEGAAYLGTFLNYLQHTPVVSDGWLGGSSHFYTTYKTSDGKYLVVGSLEGKFYETFLKAIGVDPSEFPQFPPSEEARMKLSIKISEKTRDEWTAIFKDIDACVTPLLTPEEASTHPHNLSRKSFRHINIQDELGSSKSSTVHVPRPPLRFSDTPDGWEEIDLRPVVPGSNTVEVLDSFGYGADEIQELLREEVVYDHKVKSNL